MRALSPRFVPPACLLAPIAGCLLAPIASRAAPPPDPSGIFTVQVENDALTGTDRDYTAGERLAWTSPTGAVPDMLSGLGHALWGGGQQRVALGLTQSLFTPADTQIAPPDPHDRPYAGILLADAALIHDTDATRNVLDLGLGVIGSDAQGSEVQDGFHEVIGQNGNRGWGAQLPNQPVVELTAQRIWRLPVARPGDLEFDALPELTAAAGTWRIYGAAGGEFRLGQGLAADFGMPRIRPGMTGTDAYVAVRRFAWYIFVGAEGQAVAFDETLDGEPFTHTAHVAANPLVGEMEGGLAVMAWGMRISFVEVVQTQEFRGQTGGLFKFSSASVSMKF
ncbi:MAG TPA: lipid A deacylase LpxR family protein [Acetobacteraceae bacterium]|nr:lipid A deacylase LpxR family protein [Acetobacteraceae bacterium]